jgi:hypothetical protein
LKERAARCRKVFCTGPRENLELAPKLPKPEVGESPEDGETMIAILRN